MEGSDDEEAEGPFEVIGVHRLKLAPGSRSGYVGVRPNKQLQEAPYCRAVLSSIR